MSVENLELELLDDESARQALEIVGELANQNNIDWALAGGLALILYGSDRLTKDIDIVASNLLPMAEGQIVGKLRQGGERYIAKTPNKNVVVDWIIRRDEFRDLFRVALREATTLKGIPILTPEWLVILKFIAGRFKDQEDAVFLLSRPGLVDRKLVREKIEKTLGKPAWGLARHGYQRWYDLADGRRLDEEQDDAEGFIDS